MIDVVESLQQSEIFQGVEEQDLAALAQVMQRQHFQARELLFERGDEGNRMFEIIAGSIRIFTQDDQGNELTIVVRKAGEVVGELALLDRQPRSASAIADEPVEVLVLERQDFLDFLHERPAVGMQMMRTLTSRIRYTTNYLQRIMDWIDRLGQGDYEQALAELSSEEQGQGPIAELVAAFIQMVHSVKERQADLETGQDK